MVVELKNSLFQICIVIVITLVIFNLAVAFVDGTGVFQTEYKKGFQPTEGADANSTFGNLTGPQVAGMGNLWSLVLTAAGITGLFLAWLTRSLAIVGIVIFSIVFWATYINTLGIVHATDLIPGSFILIGTTAMFFVWAGAIIGMLTGSG